jgi:hypothetical protein
MFNTKNLAQHRRYFAVFASEQMRYQLLFFHKKAAQIVSHKVMNDTRTEPFTLCETMF